MGLFRGSSTPSTEWDKTVVYSLDCGFVGSQPEVVPGDGSWACKDKDDHKKDGEEAM